MCLLRDKVCLAVQLMLNEVMDWELEAVIGAALYERTATRRDYRNGRYERGLVTGVGPVTLDGAAHAQRLHQSGL